VIASFNSGKGMQKHSSAVSPRPRTLPVHAAVGLVLLLGLSACDDSETPLTAAGPAAIANAAASSQGNEKERQRKEFGEENLAELERAVPSAGGFFVNDDGSYSVWLTNPAHAQRARVAMQSLVKTKGLPNRSRGLPDVRVLQGRYTFTQLEDWRDRIFEEGMKSNLGLRSLDLDEGSNRISIGVRDNSVRASLLSQLAAKGIDPEAIVIRVVPRFKPETRRSVGLTVFAPPANTGSDADTLVGGVRIITSTPGDCSLGIVANHSSGVLAITATHCSSDSFGVDGTDMFQASTSRKVGDETVDNSGYTCWYGHCRWHEASGYSLVSGINAYVGKILRTESPNNGTPFGGDGSRTTSSPNPYFTVYSVENGDMPEGTRVDKVGNSSGWTYGEITSTCRHVWLDDWPADVAMCLYEADYYSEGGDSGGPVFYIIDGNLVKFAGIHSGEVSAGVKAFSPWHRIVAGLGGGLNLNVNQPTPPGVLSASIVGTDQIQSSHSCSWGATVSNAAGTVTYQWAVNGETQSETSNTLSHTNNGANFTLSVAITASNGVAYAEKTVTVTSGYYCT
jgi:hypothetical protein